MIIFPAIDLRHGRCVGLRQGDPHTELVFSEDPAAVARHWVEQGAEWLYVVNLDGPLQATAAHLHALHRSSNILVQHPGSKKAESPEAELHRQLPLNLQQLRRIRQAVRVPIQFGGGIRTLDDIRLVLELGADRVVLGTAAIEDPEFVAMALDKWGGDRIVVAIAARAGQVATHGWQSVTNVNTVDLGHRMHAMGVKRVIYTDINRDGMLSGVNLDETMHLGDVTNLRVIASGGVASLADIEALKAHEHYNIEGVIVGHALYTGQLDLRAAIDLGHQPLRRRSAGIIPYRYHNGEVEFLLLFNIFFEQWQFPRGGVKAGESDPACAQRELDEETGLPVVQFHEDCEVVLEYTAIIRDYEIERTVVYYLAQVASQEVRLGDEDHCEARWLSTRETWELLTETSPEQLPAFDSAVAYLTAQQV